VRGRTWNASAQPAAPRRAKAASRLHVIPCCTATPQSKSLPSRLSCALPARAMPRAMAAPTIRLEDEAPSGRRTYTLTERAASLELGLREEHMALDARVILHQLQLVRQRARVLLLDVEVASARGAQQLDEQRAGLLRHPAAAARPPACAPPQPGARSRWAMALISLAPRERLRTALTKALC